MNKLNSKIIEILTGLILGDAHINRSNNLSYLTVEQGIKHKPYVLSLYDTISSQGIPLYDIKYYTRLDKRYDKINESIYFKSHNLESLNLLSDMFLNKEGEKMIPKNIKDYLGPIALSYWICDDGQLVKNGGITLCTDNYSYDDVDILIQALNDKYEIKCSIHNKKGKSGNVYRRIYIKKNDLLKMKPLLLENMHKSFLYKLHA